MLLAIFTFATCITGCGGQAAPTRGMSYGVLRIESDPPGAHVWLLKPHRRGIEKYLGQTPTSTWGRSSRHGVYGATPIEFNFLLKKRGYRDTYHDATLFPNAPSRAQAGANPKKVFVMLER
jgi:hypothetical protein